MADINGILRDLQQERSKLDQAIKALQPLVSTNGQRPAVKTASGVVRPALSAAARRKISAAQKLRWARVRAGKTKTNSKGSRARVISIAARRKMQASQKARRARERAQQNKKAA